MTTFKEYLNGDVVADANPFAIRVKSGDTEWVKPFDTSIQNDHLRLIQKVGSDDGVLEVKIKDGFRVDFKLKSSEDFAFARVAESYAEQGYPTGHVAHSSSGIGGSSSLWLSMWGGDLFDIWKTQDGKTAITLNLRRSAFMDDGGWETTDEGLSRWADIVVTLQSVLRYTEATGDYEGIGLEESADVTPDEGDRWGEDDTPISTTYHPMDDDDLVLDTVTDFQPSAMMGAIMLMAMIAGLATLMQVKA